MNALWTRTVHAWWLLYFGSAAAWGYVLYAAGHVRRRKSPPSRGATRR